MKKSKGFTLIELLVVIAIIGVLSSVVLASLNTARSKGNDAGVKANLSTVGTQAVLYFSDNNAYGAFDNGSGAGAACPLVADEGATVFHEPTIKNAIATALVDAASDGTTMCRSTDTEYAVAVSRPAGSGSTYWCVDSIGTRCGINQNALDGENALCGACDSTN
ncbi:MAG: type II secretion system protein [Candidatus Paceibacterota bacterium]|jgi:prepilin-type N-terminal cleavage/methylation domain-containing protein